MANPTIPLKQAHEIVRSARAVLADLNGTCVLFPGLDDLSGDGHNEFMYLTCEADCEEYSTRFLEGGNATVEVDGETLVFMDDEGDPVRITPLFCRPLI